MTTSPNIPNEHPQPSLESTNICNATMEVTVETTGQDDKEKIMIT